MKPYLLATLVLILLTGCSILDEETQMNKTAQQLAAEGAAAFMNQDYKDAVKAYTDLKDWYPFSKYAILAELKVADAHFHLEAYAEALAAYENFEKMHPRNEAVPYVINQMGLCWFKQIDTIDRDPTPAKSALVHFRRVMQQYPQSEYAKDAGKNIDACIDNIAGHELYVADFYKKTKKYDAALKRYQFIVEFYPETDQGRTALSKIPDVTQRLEKQVEQ